MAKVVAYRSIDMSDTSVFYGDVIEATSRKIIISDGHLTGTYLGSFRYDDYEVYGSLTGYTFAEYGSLSAAVSDFSVDANWFYRALASGNSAAARTKILLGSDKVFGSGQSDTLRGYSGDDVISGRSGSDRINGDRGNDRLIGDRGADRLSGGAGSDKLIGGDGNDKLFGGTGRDTFVFGQDSGSDILKDFENRRDKIEIMSGASSFEDLQISRAGTAVTISFADSEIEIEDSRIRHFDEGDFIFS